ncbi:putative RNA helicase [Leishmania major strain Friedlin]|uniref:RNA helicase n=3 Tax=Leishmania major TaxID=5664 RepID=Q4Q0J4_LEIMA|nr:putative RNA helicase [Leishmania major strain Friedlin]CAG9584121.1 RNA_helicase_-_putative [Leishmania major strain Friedlin]CAJ09541.1 putative RNA helicase [Leishmania major strain Friedlin]|eukprot:XP_001687154.1 putative RNA helicase [Leishmania major strain Friedlin]
MAGSSPDLPVTEAWASIVRMIRKNQAVIVVGETGSGKTTQIPQYVWDDILSKRPGAGIVGCTQPRRVAAVSIARHVARQRGGKVGGEVAYAVRFDDTCTSATRIKFLTDGILLREIQADPVLSKYGCIILDEAHERTLHGDVLFGLLKAIARQREDSLKIVVMSATLNAEHFSKFWWNAPIGVVHGRMFPVTIMHTVEPQADYVEAAISTILLIHHTEPPGDILCFLTGQEEVEDAKRILLERMKLLPNDVPDFSVLTLYAAMPYEQQLLVFEPNLNEQRKVILATNIAETSITVEGIRYVVDSGVVKAKYYNSKSGMEMLTEVDISRAQATQRTGRAGRVAAGKCYRLYTANAFENLSENTIPEIRRSSLLSVVLQMKSLHIHNILAFEFMDMPRPRAVAKAEETLMLLQALDKAGHITALGARLTDFPIEPMPAMVLLAAKALGVAREAVIVIAMSSTDNLFLTSREFKEAADRCRAAFAKSAGDHATLLSIYQAYCHSPRDQRKTWCESNAMSHRQMLKVEDVITQLQCILEEKSDSELLAKIIPASLRYLRAGAGGDLSTQLHKRPRGEIVDDTNDLLERYEELRHGGGGLSTGATERKGKLLDAELLRRALCFGYFLNAAFYNAKLGMYQTIVGQLPVYIHPSSVLFTHRKKPALVIFNSVVRTTKRYMKDVSVVQEEWLQDAAPDFLTAAS